MPEEAKEKKPVISDADFLTLTCPNYGKKEYWMELYPGFSEQQCEILEAYTWSEMGPKELKRYVKKRYGVGKSK